MPIRVGTRQPPLPPPPDELPEDTPEVTEPDTPVSPDAPSAEPTGRFSADKVSPAIARYMTSDMGPFICANCEHFTGAGDCDVVSGPIDPEGVCILFTPSDDAEGEAEDVEPVPEPGLDTEDVSEAE